MSITRTTITIDTEDVIDDFTSLWTGPMKSETVVSPMSGKDADSISFISRMETDDDDDLLESSEVITRAHLQSKERFKLFGKSEGS